MEKIYQLRYDIDKGQWIIERTVENNEINFAKLQNSEKPQELYAYSVYPSIQTSLHNNLTIEEAEKRLLELYNSHDDTIYKRCKSCGSVFEISKDEQDWFIYRLMHTPERCFNCRKKGVSREKGQSQNDY